MKIQVKRAFYIGGVVQPVGAVIEVDKPLGIELVAMTKAVAYSEPEQAEAETVKPKRVKKGADDVAI